MRYTNGLHNTPRPQYDIITYNIIYYIVAILQPQLFFDIIVIYLISDKVRRAPDVFYFIFVRTYIILL